MFPLDSQRRRLVKILTPARQPTLSIQSSDSLLTTLSKGRYNMWASLQPKPKIRVTNNVGCREGVYIKGEKT